MEKGIIEAMVASTPRSELDAVQDDHEIWEETEGDAHYKVTRHLLPGSTQREAIFISVSGPAKDRLRVIKEFKAVLGVPVQGDVNLKDEQHLDVVSWLV